MPDDQRIPSPHALCTREDLQLMLDYDLVTPEFRARIEAALKGTDADIAALGKRSALTMA